MLFHQGCKIQKLLAPNCGAGFSQACIVDIWAQNLTVCCVEEGMCVAGLRMNLNFLTRRSIFSGDMTIFWQRN
ncbi:hypothetical protein BDZ91DRAFT_173632 [Kalaharituber pfeilii]|nr:hypothetical protein BDZ91DRAFT_173632 [Kalaharituber pfeilii]